MKEITTTTNGNQVLFWMGLERTKENIQQDLQFIKIHAENEEITQISYESHNLGNNGLFIDNKFTNVLNSLQKTKLNSFYPMITTVNIPMLQELLLNKTNMNFFINQALQYSLINDITGFNIDFEPLRCNESTALANDFVLFIDTFANQLHKINKKLTVCVASWSYFWDIKKLINTSVDKVITMDTYATNADTFNKMFYSTLDLIGKENINKLGVGLMTDLRVNETELFRRIDLIKGKGINEIDVWQMPPPSDFWWNAMYKYLHN
ncbi:hypothetical protein ABK040_010579 [Willaertia magna]